MPLLPPSDEPTASIIIRLGKRSKNWSFTDGENVAALDVRWNDETSHAVPVACERLDQRPRHRVACYHDRVDLLFLDEAPHAAGVELAHQDDLVPEEALAHDRPLRRAVHERRDRQERERHAHLRLLDHELRLLGAHVRHRIDAAAERHEDVLVPPDDALRHARRAAGVEDVAVARRARREVALGRAARDGGLVRHGADRR
jgi:hypothetical protein